MHLNKLKAQLEELDIKDKNLGGLNKNNEYREKHSELELAVFHTRQLSDENNTNNNNRIEILTQT